MGKPSTAVTILAGSCAGAAETVVTVSLNSPMMLVMADVAVPFRIH
jgi:hypothetical protein